MSSSKVRAGLCAMTMRCFALVALVVCLALIMVPHELGHLAICKATGVWVPRFTIFLGEPIVAVQLGETEYAIGRYPIGAANIVFDKKLPLEIENLVRGPLFAQTSPFLEHMRKKSPENAVALSKYERWYAYASKVERAAIVLCGPLFGIFFGGVTALLASMIAPGIQKTNTKRFELRPFCRDDPANIFWDGLLLPWRLIRGKASWDSVAGPLGILQASLVLIAGSWRERITFLSALSVAVSYFNLLPLPGLDGWKLAMLALEWMTGSSQHPMAEYFAQHGTTCLLGCLVLLVVIDFHRMATHPVTGNTS